MALGILRRVWGEVRQWKTCFEEHGADGRLIDQLMRAFRDLSDIASPELEAEIRKGAPPPSARLPHGTPHPFRY